MTKDKDSQKHSKSRSKKSSSGSSGSSRSPQSSRPHGSSQSDRHLPPWQRRDPKRISDIPEEGSESQDYTEDGQPYQAQSGDSRTKDSHNFKGVKVRPLDEAGRAAFASWHPVADQAGSELGQPNVYGEGDTSQSAQRALPPLNTSNLASGTRQFGDGGGSQSPMSSRSFRTLDGTEGQATAYEDVPEGLLPSTDGPSVDEFAKMSLSGELKKGKRKDRKNSGSSASASGNNQKRHGWLPGGSSSSPASSLSGK